MPKSAVSHKSYNDKSNKIDADASSQQSPSHIDHQNEYEIEKRPNKISCCVMPKANIMAPEYEFYIL